MPLTRTIFPEKKPPRLGRAKHDLLVELYASFEVSHPMFEQTLRYHPKGLVSVHVEIWDGNTLLYSDESSSDRRFSVHQTLIPLLRDGRIELRPGHTDDTCQVSWWTWG